MYRCELSVDWVLFHTFIRQLAVSKRLSSFQELQRESNTIDVGQPRLKYTLAHELTNCDGSEAFFLAAIAMKVPPSCGSAT